MWTREGLLTQSHLLSMSCFGKQWWYFGSGAWHLPNEVQLCHTLSYGMLWRGGDDCSEEELTQCYWLWTTRFEKQYCCFTLCHNKLRNIMKGVTVLRRVKVTACRWNALETMFTFSLWSAVTCQMRFNFVLRVWWGVGSTGCGAKSTHGHWLSTKCFGKECWRFCCSALSPVTAEIRIFSTSATVVCCVLLGHGRRQKQVSWRGFDVIYTSVL